MGVAEAFLGEAKIPLGRKNKTKQKNTMNLLRSKAISQNHCFPQTLPYRGNV